MLDFNALSSFGLMLCNSCLLVESVSPGDKDELRFCECGGCFCGCKECESVAVSRLLGRTGPADCLSVC